MALSFLKSFFTVKVQGNSRNLYISSVKSSNLPTDNTQPPTSSSTNPNESIRKVTTLTGLQRWALVFSGKYKSKAEIPQYVSLDVLDRARGRARVRLSNYLIAMTLLGCLAFAYSGRQAAKRGESVQQMNIDWHKDYNEKIRQEREEKEKDKQR